MLAIGDSNTAAKFTIKYEPKESKDFKYIFVEPGFFKLVVLPMLPFLIFGHLVHGYGLYLVFIQRSIPWYTFFASSMFMLWAGFGVTAGSHRLWCHRSYEAGFFFRVFLMIGHTMSGQYSIYRSVLVITRHLFICKFTQMVSRTPDTPQVQ